jgi:hypothetical protein
MLKYFAILALLAAFGQPAFAADKNYTRGSVWIVSLIKTEPGKSDDYIDSLKAEYTTLYEEALKQKIVLSYKILVGDSANPDDWDVLIEQELPNFAALDTLEEKFDGIAAKLYGSQTKADDTQKQEMTARVAIRKIFGGKIMQEIHYVK